MRAAWFAGALAALAPSLVLAHPLDEVVQGAYLTLAPGQVQLELDLTPGPLVVDGMLKALDANGDQRITQVEARAYAERVAGQSTLTLNGAPVAWQVDRVSVPAYAALKAGDTLKIYATAPRAEGSGPHVLAYENRYQPAKSQCIANVFLLPGNGWSYQVTGQQRSDDGRGLTVTYAGARA